eukprot:233145-Chlamydomonas_euryale.AAC.1
MQRAVAQRAVGMQKEQLPKGQPGEGAAHGILPQGPIPLGLNARIGGDRKSHTSTSSRRRTLLD